MEDTIGKVIKRPYDFRKDDPDEFAIPAYDHKGEMQKAYFRAPGTWLTTVSEILAKRHFPYRTPSHLYRHALWKHLKWMRNKDGRLREVVDWMESSINIVKKYEKRRKLGDITAYMDKEIDAQKRAGAYSEARKIAIEQMKMVAESGPSDVWKRKMMKHIRSKHGDLLVMGASLDPAMFEKEE